MRLGITTTATATTALLLCSVATVTSFAAFVPSQNIQSSKSSWQDDLEEVLNPLTPPGRRQILLQELLNASSEIQASVATALLDRNIDPLLTPTGRKLRTGTRAVARQLRSDILPSLASQRAPSLPSMDWSKIGVRFFNAVQKQVIQGIETALSDLSNPGNIPNRLSQQTSDLIKEASNIFSETPIGLKEPSYTVIKQTDDYEIRDYARYKVASVNLDATDVGQTTAGFNTLAAYIFGANRGNQVLEMTTPVMTTMSGEMRFYLASDSVPDPLAFDESKNVYEQDRIFLSDIPAARLAIRRFTGFVTDGEVMRQKQALLTALALDGVELDVPHGQTVGHVVFQYNPPYTLPVLRRNELAVAVLNEQDDPWQNSVEERA